ncbi:MAG TPA: hypothetical protein VF297_11195 [Pyrinomonadaceae bacterium]
MSDNPPCWFDLAQEEIEAELAEESRQNALTEETYRELLEMPDSSVAHTNEF